MSRIFIANKIDHDVMYDVEQTSYTPEVREYWTRERFMTRHVNLPAIGFWSDEKCIGGVYMDDGFIHVSVRPEFHGKWATLYTRGLEWAMSHAEPIYAAIIAGNKKCVRFAEHSGWEKIGLYNDTVYYRSTAQFHERLKNRRRIAEFA